MFSTIIKKKRLTTLSLQPSPSCAITFSPLEVPCRYRSCANPYTYCPPPLQVPLGLEVQCVAGVQAHAVVPHLLQWAGVPPAGGHAGPHVQYEHVVRNHDQRDPKNQLLQRGAWYKPFF